MAENTAGSGTLGWLLQRFTGALLAVGLFTHINLNHFTGATSGGTGLINFRAVTEHLQASPTFWTIFYLLFLPSAIYHGLNGVYAVITDFTASAGARRKWTVLFWIVGIFFTAYGVFGLFGMLRA